MKLATAEKLANLLAEELRRDGVCKLAEVAGSVRRRRPEVKDIELVVVPVWGTDMFGEPNPKAQTQLDLWLERELGQGFLKQRKKWGPRQKQVIHAASGVTIEFFIVRPPAQFGVIYTIRTGPWEFSKWLVTKKKKGGAMPAYLRQKDGALWYKEEMLETPIEDLYFEQLGLDWIPPTERDAFIEEKVKY